MQGRTVQLSEVKTYRRVEEGMYARILAELLDLKRGQAREYPCRDRKHAYHIARSVADLAKKEALKIKWGRNQNSTAVYLWVDIEGVQ